MKNARDQNILANLLKADTANVAFHEVYCQIKLLYLPHINVLYDHFSQYFSK